MSRRATAATEVVPTFVADPSTLDALGPPVRPAGVVLGADPDAEPVSVALLRPTPTRVVVLGGLGVALQVTLRAVATGARVVVVTGRPAAWEPVRVAAGTPDPDDPTVVVRQDPETPIHGSSEAPLLVVHDRGATARAPAAARGPWQTTLVVLPSLVPAVTDLADDADLVLLARMPPPEAELAERLWRLPASMGEELRTLPDRSIIVLGRNLWRRVELVTTPREAALLGGPGGVAATVRRSGSPASAG